MTSATSSLARLQQCSRRSRELVCASLREGAQHIRRLREQSCEGLPLAADVLAEQEEIYKLLDRLLLE